MSRQRKDRWRMSGCNVNIKISYTEIEDGVVEGLRRLKEWRLKLPYRKREPRSSTGKSVVWEDGMMRSPPWETSVSVGNSDRVGRGMGVRGSFHAEVRAGEARGG